MFKFITGIIVSFFLITVSVAEALDHFSLITPPSGNPGTTVTVSPAMIPSGTNPGTPNPPTNPHNTPGPSKPGAVVTIPWPSGGK